METPQGQKYCRNCHFPMGKSDSFCTKCGQKYTTGRHKLRHLIKDFFSEVFWFDSKMHRTIPALLFKPGFLTKAYFKGRHERYFSPLRMFFFLSVVHFGLIAYAISQKGGDGSDFNFGPNIGKSWINKMEIQADFDSSAISIKQHYSSPEVALALDSLREELGLPSDEDSLSLSNNSILSLKQGVRMQYKDIHELSSSELLDKYEVKGFWNRLATRQTTKFFKSNDSFGRFFLKRLSWFSLLMIPIFALLLKLIYARRKRYLVEHFVFAFHYHSFAFLIFSLLIICRNTAIFDQLVKVGTLGVIIYLYFAMLGFYGQGKLKTFFKFLLLNFGYLLGFLVSLILFVLLSFILF